MPLLSSLVFLGIICSRCCEQHHCLHRDFSTSKTTALPPPPLPLLRSDHRLHHRKVISSICLSVKYRHHRTFNAPLEFSALLARAFMRRRYSSHAITCHHVPPLSVTRLHALPCARTRSADVIIFATSTLVTSSLLALATRQLAYVSTQQRSRHHHWPLTSRLTVDFDRTLTLIVDFFPGLTFSIQVLLTQFFA